MRTTNNHIMRTKFLFTLNTALKRELSFTTTIHAENKTKQNKQTKTRKRTNKRKPNFDFCPVPCLFAKTHHIFRQLFFSKFIIETTLSAKHERRQNSNESEKMAYGLI